MTFQNVFKSTKTLFKTTQRTFSVKKKNFTRSKLPKGSSNTSKNFENPTFEATREVPSFREAMVEVKHRYIFNFTLFRFFIILNHSYYFET